MVTATIATAPRRASPNSMKAKSKNRCDFDPWSYSNSELLYPDSKGKKKNIPRNHDLVLDP